MNTTVAFIFLYFVLEILAKTGLCRRRLLILLTIAGPDHRGYSHSSNYKASTQAAYRFKLFVQMCISSQTAFQTLLHCSHQSINYGLPISLIRLLWLNSVKFAINDQKLDIRESNEVNTSYEVSAYCIQKITVACVRNIEDISFLHSTHRRYQPSANNTLKTPVRKYSMLPSIVKER